MLGLQGVVGTQDGTGAHGEPPTGLFRTQVGAVTTRDLTAEELRTSAPGGSRGGQSLVAPAPPDRRVPVQATFQI